MRVFVFNSRCFEPTAHQNASNYDLIEYNLRIVFLSSYLSFPKYYTLIKELINPLQERKGEEKRRERKRKEK